MDRTEVTVAAYGRCVEAGACEPAHAERRTCNAGRQGRSEHPINCVDHEQASKYCAWRAARLPSEVEWEYVARGGEEYLPFPWGRAPADGRTCWKHVGGSCRVGEYPAGAFGLQDIVGNVWEWTSSAYGRYPWPPAQPDSMVYRGGSWSRRFEKWLSPTLRNRGRPTEWGSHLGFRCALTPADVNCRFGRSSEQRCPFGVLDAECPSGKTWNGVRCATREEPLCPPGRHVEAGHGCVLDVPEARVAERGDPASVSRGRSPEFDADCAAHYPGRLRAFRYAGGTHHDRNRISRAAGCTNRDVGVGWNSTCCP